MSFPCATGGRLFRLCDLLVTSLRQLLSLRVGVLVHPRSKVSRKAPGRVVGTDVQFLPHQNVFKDQQALVVVAVDGAPGTIHDT